jgi:hypothetical protein
MLTPKLLFIGTERGGDGYLKKILEYETKN